MSERKMVPFNRPLYPSAELAEIVGPEPRPRTEITKAVWQYIRKHDLQDPANRRMINADDKLLAVFNGRAQANMFEMAKVLGKHMSDGAAPLEGKENNDG